MSSKIISFFLGNTSSDVSNTDTEESDNTSESREDTPVKNYNDPNIQEVNLHSDEKKNNLGDSLNELDLQIVS